MNLTDLWLRLRALVFRKRVEEELQEELDFHLEMQTRKNRPRDGNDARRRALARFGSPAVVAEECRDERRIHLIENVVRDIRYALRQWRKSPGFAVIAILTLALGIGANAALFELVNALRFRTLPVKDPQQLVDVHLVDREHTRGTFRGRFSSLSHPLWEEIRDRQQAFSGTFAWGNERFNVAAAGEKRYADGLWVSGDFFQVLGVQPAAGRLFSASDDTRGCPNPGAVISYGFWLRQYGGAPSTVGDSVTLDRHRFQILGVAAAGFVGVEPGQTFDVAIPLCAEPLIAGQSSLLARRDGWWLSFMGRLKPGWSMAQADASLRAISPDTFRATLPPNYPPDYAKWYLSFKLGAYTAAAGISALRDDYETPLWILMATTGLVLLIACANLANLLLARANARSREVSVRLALGASRARLLSQFLTESLLLATAGAAAGGLLSRVLAPSLVNFLSTSESPLFLNLSPDWRIFGFISALAALTCILFGLLPAIRAAQNAPGSAGGRGLTASKESHALRKTLVVSQVALSLLLLVSAFLFTRTLLNLANVDTGFTPAGLSVVRVDVRGVAHDIQTRPALYGRVLERLRMVTGIESAAQARVVPLSGSFWDDDVRVGDKTGDAVMNTVSDGYFKTTRMQILAGRDFTDRDNNSSPQVAIVNEAFSREFLKGASPIGVQFHVEAEPGQPPPVTYDIVGLVRDAKYASLRRNVRPTVFFAALQEKPATTRSFILRSNTDIAELTTSLTNALVDVDPAIAFDLKSLSTDIRELLLQEQLLATTTGFFGVLATAIAILGLYGVLAYMVSQRRKEIGVRMALGASRVDVSRMILREATVLIAIGLFLGTALSMAATKVVGRMLFGVQPNDAATIVLAVATLGIVAAIASYLPARRAANIDPMQTLREN